MNTDKQTLQMASQSLRGVCLLDDVCVYREITPDAALCEFFANLTPSVDPRDMELASHQLVRILDAMRAG